MVEMGLGDKYAEEAEAQRKPDAFEQLMDGLALVASLPLQFLYSAVNGAIPGPPPKCTICKKEINDLAVFCSCGYAICFDHSREQIQAKMAELHIGNSRSNGGSN